MEIDMVKHPSLDYWNKQLDDFLAVQLESIDNQHRKQGTIGSQQHKNERESIRAGIEMQKKEIEDEVKEAEKNRMREDFYIQNTKQDIGNTLIKAIPKEKDSRLDEAWKIARRLVKEIYLDVDNFYLAQCLNRKVTRVRYPEVQNQYLPQILNRIRTIRKYWKDLKYNIVFTKRVSKVIKTP